jgi:hypothetical protein
MYYYLQNVAINISSVVLEESILSNSILLLLSHMVSAVTACFGAGHSLLMTESFRRKLEFLVALPLQNSLTTSFSKSKSRLFIAMCGFSFKFS